MKIVSHGRAGDNKAICSNCNTTVAYEDSDIQFERGQKALSIPLRFTTVNYYEGGYNYLDCPVCSKRIPISAGMRSQGG